MLVLGLQGSPRIKGNTGILLDAFLKEAGKLGANTLRVDVARKKIFPCVECGTCEREGVCPIDDDMQEIYTLLWQADLVVMATPIFFYGPTAQMKALIDRCQALWARKYVHKLSDPGRKWRSGLLLSVGATKGKNLFDGTSLTAQYFFDAVGARFAGSVTFRQVEFAGSVTFRQVENAGEVQKHPTALREVEEKARALVPPYLARKKILFVCRENAGRSQMGGAFARFHGGDALEVDSAGSAPVADVNPVAVMAMEEKGIDMAYRKPQSIERVLDLWRPDAVISMGCEEACPVVPGASMAEWELPDPADKTIDVIRHIRDDIEQKVKGLLH